LKKKQREPLKENYEILGAGRILWGTDVKEWHGIK
jgi:hypothetical protein